MYAGRTNSIVKTGGATPTQTKEVKATSFPTVVSPDSGYALSQATVTAPDNLTAENIKSGVSIAGVTGTYEGGGSGQLDDRAKFWMRTIQNGGRRYDAEGHFIPLVMLKEYWPDILQGNEYTDAYNPKASLVMSKYCLANVELESVELPEGRGTDGTTHIPECAFYKAGQNRYVNGTYHLMTVTGGASEIYTFGREAFGYANLNDVPNINYYNNKIPENAFRHANLVTCNVPEGITGLTAGCLESILVKNKKVTLPSTLTTISGYYALSGDYSNHLNIIMKSTTPPTMDNSSSINYIDSITVPAGTLEAYRTATNWSAFADIMVEATVDAGTTEGGA